MKRSPAICLLLTGFFAACTPEQGGSVFRSQTECEEHYTPEQCKRLLSEGRPVYSSAQRCEEWTDADQCRPVHHSGGLRYYSWITPRIRPTDLETHTYAQPGVLGFRPLKPLGAREIQGPVRRGGFGGSARHFFGRMSFGG